MGNKSRSQERDHIGMKLEHYVSNNKCCYKVDTYRIYEVCENS